MDSRRENLNIRNFLSVKNFDWEIKDFNIITGDMGSGKSLCIKLLKFFEDIIPDLLVLPYEPFLSNMDYAVFSERLAKEFCNIFYFEHGSSKHDLFCVEYTFSYKDNTVKIVVENDENGNILIKSDFLQVLLANWKRLLDRQKTKTPDGFGETKLFLHNELQKEFGSHFPIATTFIPASRAALAFNSGPTDTYLREYKEIIDVLPRFKSRRSKLVNSILKAKTELKNGELFLKSGDGRKVPIAKASSGQQEIVYVLMLLEKLGNFLYSYGIEQSVFIEEPSAHLFPLEQKQTVELVVEIFNQLKGTENPVRLFITTHSPYILDSMNNILKKGRLIEKYGEKVDIINAEVGIPPLFVNEVSAYFIGDEGVGKSMIDEKERYIYGDRITKISVSINEDTKKLFELNNALLDSARE
jgi:ABC-type lipoprotein export system ATPase subunit